MAKEIKKELKETGSNKQLLAGKSLVMIFEKPSLRTKISFALGMNQLGGHSVSFGGSEIGLDARESVKDIARVISQMADGIVARVCNHETLVELAQYATIPVINGLSPLEHPCQVLADLMTVWEAKGTLEGLIVSYVGDGHNNMTHSLCLTCGLLGMDFRCACPKGYWMDKLIVKRAKHLAAGRSTITEYIDPRKATKTADVVVADTWISMGDTVGSRIEDLAPYQVNQELMNHAKPDCLFLHSLPAHRGQEVTGEIIDGPRSVVFSEAGNRLHVQKALLVWLLRNVPVVTQPAGPVQ